MEQTIKTIKSLFSAGFKNVYLFDNSCKEINKAMLLEHFPVGLTITHQIQYPFANKGINEALLLLNNLHLLPNEQKIFKISGRYFASEGFDIEKAGKLLDTHDCAGKGYDFYRKNGLISTRGYFVKNKNVYESILVKAVEEIFTYGAKIYGLKSALNSVQHLFNDSLGAPFQISMEHAFARVIKKHHLIVLLDKLNIAGYVAGSDHLELIEE